MTERYAQIPGLFAGSVTFIAADLHEIINSLCLSGISELWVLSYFLLVSLIFNLNTYNKLPPKANY